MVLRDVGEGRLRRGWGRALGLAIALAALVLPASAAAWTVTVKIHGAGGVAEVPNRFGETKNQGSCFVGPGGKSESSIENCVLGSAGGLWNSGNVVRLAPVVSTTAAARGWQFQKWVDGTGSGQINCDPQDTTGNQISPTYCEFQIFENLYVDLYFDDVSGPQDTSISGGPALVSQSTSATFGFNASSDPDASFECRLDPPGSEVGSYFACGTPSDKSESFAGLANGQHTFYVRGKDPSGNVDATPASRTWTVDTVAPTITVNSGPAGITNQNDPTFGFDMNEAGATTCQLDSGSIVGCAGSKSYTGIPDGEHTFTVRGQDTAGNVATPVTRAFTVDTVAPAATITKKPPRKVRLRRGKRATVAFKFEADEAGSSFLCKLDGTKARPCASPERYRVKPGKHLVKIWAIDVATNRGPAAKHAFKVVKRRR